MFKTKTKQSAGDSMMLLLFTDNIGYLRDETQLLLIASHR